ncbi:Membrane protein TerC, possibly involved in tellurium resistance [Lampropedia hyalina DSM 16112]|jgi:CBS domain containing-hemolysin-like protein|uniref:Membrane protein TerC, possibly involved in tellurium resistance n=1 Tax=Lampropedia hyalina DSM 16112 TaxID=1122156 RepID=A0A1M4S765_9BURK|nr:TerC family protein [Lampropedia hyalina]SHE28030.1 Membrane protein TerC, possibly involved in tellurium resistance [Lampropedia hyalina DSM 16112]
MEWLSDPAVWIGLLTLIVLEIVLGIDNLVFIAILADKLPQHQRDKARIIGLTLALVMRLALLSVMAQIIKLTTPIFGFWIFDFSWRDLILLGGGLFLLWKATTELHERLEGVLHAGPARKGYASFGLVLVQIVILDAVFSLDSIITAVGMVQHLPVMMAAVIIAMVVMIVASKPLTQFVNRHPTVVVLCLGFLLMIGLTLVAEGLGFHFPKGYLYAAIGFSILIESLNQWRQRNMLRHESLTPYRDRTARTVLRLLGDRHGLEETGSSQASQVANSLPEAFGDEERKMVSGVLTLAERSVLSVMTPRADVEWIDITASKEDLYQQLVANPHGLFPVCDRNGLDNVLGIARAKDLLADVVQSGGIDTKASVRQPLIVPESISVIKLTEMLRHSRRQMALISDEYGTILGLVTPMDVLEAIAGEFPDVGEVLDIQPVGAEHWSVDGGANLHALEQATGIHQLTDEDEEYTTVAGLMLHELEMLPEVGQTLEYAGLRLEITEMDDRRVTRVDVRKLHDEPLQAEGQQGA